MPPPTMQEVMSIPTYAGNVNNSIGSIVDYYAKQQQMKQQMQMQIALEAAKQKLEMSNPLSQALTMGKIGQAATSMGVPMSDMFGMGSQQYTIDDMMRGNPYADMIPGYNQQRSWQPPTQQPIRQGGQNFNSMNPIAAATIKENPDSNGMVATEYERTPFGFSPMKLQDPTASASIKGREKAATDRAANIEDATKGSIRDDNQLMMMAQALKNLTSIHKKLSDKGYAGDVYGSSIAGNMRYVPNFGPFRGLQDKIVDPSIQKDAGKFVSARNEMLVKSQPFLTQQFGQEGSVRIMESLLHLAQQEIGDLATPHAQFKGQAYGTLANLYRIQQAANKYRDDLIASGQPMPKDLNVVTNEIYRRMPDLDERQQEELKALTDSTLGSEEQSVGSSKGTIKQPSAEEIKAARKNGYTGWDSATGEFVK